MHVSLFGIKGQPIGFYDIYFVHVQTNLYFLNKRPGNAFQVSKINVSEFLAHSSHRLELKRETSFSMRILSPSLISSNDKLLQGQLISLRQSKKSLRWKIAGFAQHHLHDSQKMSTD